MHIALIAFEECLDHQNTTWLQPNGPTLVCTCHSIVDIQHRGTPVASSGDLKVIFKITKKVQSKTTMASFSSKQ